MGTRNLTIVQKDNEYKVAQYCQYDGYPAGQGIKVLDFLHRADLNLFKKNLNKVKFISFNAINKKIKNVSNEKVYPEYDCSTGPKILDIILNSKGKTVELYNDISFARDSLFCEYAYVIDFDKNVLEVYHGFNTEPLPKGARFKRYRTTKTVYYPIKLWYTFKLNELPDKETFLDILKNKE